MGIGIFSRSYKIQNKLEFGLSNLSHSFSFIELNGLFLNKRYDKYLMRVTVSSSNLA